MKTPCPHSSYRLLAAMVVLFAVTGFGYLASNHVEPPDLHSGLPAFSLSGDGPSSSHGETPLHGLRNREIFGVHVTVTGYSSTPGQTDSTPFITASNTRVREGIVAISRDLLMKFTPGAPFQYGDLVEIQGLGTFLVEDTMNSRYTKRVDIWFPNHRTAIKWGVQKATLVKLLNNDLALADVNGDLIPSGISTE